MFRINNIFLLIAMTAIVSINALADARVQVIHNAADPMAAVVDVYVDDAKPIELDDFGFREATPFLTLPSGQAITIKFALPNSMGPNDQIVETYNVPALADGQDYILFANGVIGDNFNNPDETNRNIKIELYASTGQLQSNSQDSISANIFHGVTDAPAVDIYIDTTVEYANPTIPNLDYATSTGYVNLPLANYNILVTAAGDKNVVAGEYSLDVTPLGGAAAVIFASGFLTANDEPGMPTNRDFGLFAALADGTVIPVTEKTSGMAMVQVLHNAAVPAADQVDVYVNGALLDALDDFSFRTATPFVELPANTEINISVNAPNSTAADDQVIDTFTFPGLDADQSYVIVANGVVGDGFNNPDEGNRDITFDLFPVAVRSEPINPMNVEFVAFHGVTDAPAVNIWTDPTADEPLIGNLDYGQSSDYISVPPAAYELTVTAASDKSIVVGTYDAILSGLEGATAFVFASGFLTANDEPDSPQNRDFGLYAALADGQVVQFSQVASVKEIEFKASDLKLFPNPAVNNINVEMNSNGNTAKAKIFDMTGTLVQEHNINGGNGEALHSINTSNLGAGTYVIMIETREEIKAAPFVITR